MSSFLHRGQQSLSPPREHFQRELGPLRSAERPSDRFPHRQRDQPEFPSLLPSDLSSDPGWRGMALIAQRVHRRRGNPRSAAQRLRLERFLPRRLRFVD